MYLITSLTLQDNEGNEAEYEVGAYVDYEPGQYGWKSSYEVGEPDVSAPNCTLKASRLIDLESLAEGWSDAVCEALTELYEGRIGDAEAAMADYLYDMMREEEW